jgi:hypothetical protein
LETFRHAGNYRTITCGTVLNTFASTQEKFSWVDRIPFVTETHNLTSRRFSFAGAWLRGLAILPMEDLVKSAINTFDANKTQGFVGMNQTDIAASLASAPQVHQVVPGLMTNLPQTDLIYQNTDKRTRWYAQMLARTQTLPNAVSFPFLKLDTLIQTQSSRLNGIDSS